MTFSFFLYEPATTEIYTYVHTLSLPAALPISFCTRPTVAAKKAVKAPTAATTLRAVGDSSNIGEQRATMKTPAVTIVAAWISAETGVGPSIASGSQIGRAHV